MVKEVDSSPRSILEYRMYLLTSIPTELKWGYVLMMIRVMNNNTHRRIPWYTNEQSS